MLKYLYCSLLNINMLKNLPSLVGEKFDFLTVIEHAGKNKRGKSIYFCECICGGGRTATGSDLKRGHVKSCGCMRRGSLGTHNMSKTKTYFIWHGIKDRCFNPNHNYFKHYGGRGITVCDRWKNSFENFYADMGECPQGYSIERKDVNGDYQPSNCEWMLFNDQCKNKTTSRLLTFQGETKCLSEWAKEKNIASDTLKYRIDKLGLDLDRAFHDPVEKRAGRSSTVFLTHQGLSLTVPEWSKKTGINTDTIRNRLKHNWSVEDALTINPNKSIA